MEFMQKHPDLAHKKLRVGMGRGKFKKIWMELAKTANSVGGAVKSSQGWIKVGVKIVLIYFQLSWYIYMKEALNQSVLSRLCCLLNITCVNRKSCFKQNSQ